MLNLNNKTKNRKSKHFQNLLLILLELELALNLSPKLTKGQIFKIKRQINTVVKSIKL